MTFLSTDINGKDQLLPLKVSLNHRKMEENIINVYPHLKKKLMHGFGGALTQASGKVLCSLRDDQAESLLSSYFGPEGAGYSWVRINIDSCDFSSFMYCAAEHAEDAIARKLSFNVDEKFIFPWLEKINEIAPKPVSILLSPWSPPSYMKSNNSKKGGGTLLHEWYGVWADYLALYVKEYRDRGFSVKLLTIQNEPNAEQTWESCLFSAEEEYTFLSEYLVPAFISQGLQDEVGVLFWDHNKERLVQRAEVFLQRDVSAVAGVAFHGYCGDHFEALDIYGIKTSKKRCILTEFCLNIHDKHKPEKQLKAYAHEYIGDINHGTDTLFDWNLVLDEKGGPNHVQNFCLAPVLVENNTVNHQYAYSVLRHLGRAFPPESWSIEVTTFDSSIDVASSLNPDGTVHLVLANYGRKRKVNIRLGNLVFTAMLPAKSMNTIQLKENIDE
nr:glycoside hydrolase family 30 beta sandwich domain-containing protein [uncultured Sphaerochaeta sp.]